MKTVNLYGITFGVKYETLMNTDRIYSYSDFPEIFNIEVISVEDLGSNPTNFLEATIDNDTIFEDWETYSEEEKTSIIFETIINHLGLFEEWIIKQIAEVV